MGSLCGDALGNVFNVNVPEYWGAMVLLLALMVLGLIYFQKRKDGVLR